MEKILRGKYLVRKGELKDGSPIITITGIFRPTNFSLDDVNDNDEMWVSDIIINGGLRFTNSTHSSHSACSPEDFLAGTHQLPTDWKNKEPL